MKKILYILPWGWLADFGHGIIITTILVNLFNLEYQLVYYIFGIIFSIILDLDALDEFVKFGNVSASKERPKDHRDGFHYPIIWIIVGIIFIFINNFWGTLFLTSIMVHFLNDSWGTGWGIQWLWPLSNRSYKFFSRKNVDADVTFKNFLVSWTPAEKEKAMSEFGTSNWIRDYYLKPTKISIIEFGTFLISLMIILAII